MDPSTDPSCQQSPATRDPYQGGILHHVVDIRCILGIFLRIYINLHGFHGPLQHRTSTLTQGTRDSRGWSCPPRSVLPTISQGKAPTGAGSQVPSSALPPRSWAQLRLTTGTLKRSQPPSRDSFPQATENLHKSGEPKQTGHDVEEVGRGLEGPGPRATSGEPLPARRAAVPRKAACRPTGWRSGCSRPTCRAASLTCCVQGCGSGRRPTTRQSWAPGCPASWPDAPLWEASTRTKSVGARGGGGAGAGAQSGPRGRRRSRAQARAEGPAPPAASPAHQARSGSNGHAASAATNPYLQVKHLNRQRHLPPPAPQRRSLPGRRARQFRVKARGGVLSLLKGPPQ